MRKYQLPENIRINQITYEKWLAKKAKSIRKRNKIKDKIEKYSTENYKIAIHKAVCESAGKDFYTGEKLDWSLISKFDGKEAKKDGIKYIKKFALLPTVDHYTNRNNLDFVICSWIVNDAKSHLSHDEFISLCKKVIKHSEK